MSEEENLGKREQSIEAAPVAAEMESQRGREGAKKPDFFRRVAESWWLGPAIHLGTTVGCVAVGCAAVAAFGWRAGPFALVLVVPMAATALALPVAVTVQMLERKWGTAAATLACSCVALAPTLGLFSACG